jgi:SAM-dependent methyltransferase
MKAATFHESRRLSAAELVDHTAKCPICHSTQPRTGVLRIQRNPEVDLLHCPSCQGYSASFMPTEEYLRGYYAGYYTEKDRKVTFPDISGFARHVFRSLPAADFGENVRILDFGGGDGSMASAIAEMFLARQPNRRIELLVVDFAEPAPVKDPRINLTHATAYHEHMGQFDLVIASAILEHIPDVHPVFRDLFGAIAPGGCFYARTPYVAPFARLLPNLDLTFPAHVHDMGSGMWNRVVSLFGLPGRYVATRPSVVESTFGTFPLRTLAAYVLKFPAHIEAVLSPPNRRDRFWNLVGGWEVVIQRTADNA